MKQETFEEAAERVFKKHSNNTSLAEGYYDYMMDEEDFKEASLEINKWQQERMYSEEDIKSAWEDGRNGETECIGSYPFYKTVFKNKNFKEWFEQFKKK